MVTFFLAMSASVSVALHVSSSLRLLTILIVFGFSEEILLEEIVRTSPGNFLKGVVGMLLNVVVQASAGKAHEERSSTFLVDTAGVITPFSSMIF